MKKLIFFYLLLGNVFLQAQNVGIGTSSPDPTALLEMQTNDKGVLIPRLTTTERNAIVSPADALMIFNLTTRCLEIYNANTNAWVSIGCIDCQLPGNFVATAATSITFSSFTANWTSSIGSTSYILEVATDAGFTNYVSGYNNLNVGNVTSYSVTGLVCGTYYYRVKGSNTCGTTAVTNVISVNISSSPSSSGKVTFNYVSNAYQTWVVPCNVTSITIKAWGAGGGGGGGMAYYYSGPLADGGGGAYSNTTVSVSPGDVLYIYVGGMGEGGLSCVYSTGGGAGGWGYGSGGNGGNAGGAGCSGGGGGGGGSSAVFNSTTSTLLCVAAGGGGGGGFGCDMTDVGGAGGASGSNGNNAVCGSCGICGTGGLASSSSSQNGTNGATRGPDDGGGGGGGGGGYTNGGLGGGIGNCDCAAGGGGGGNSLGTTITNGSGRVPGNSTDSDLCFGCGYGGLGGNHYHGSGTNGGHGRVVIIY